MSVIVRNTLLLLVPFILIIVVNESVRYGFIGNEVETSMPGKLNSNRALIKQCSWNCHYHTDYCKKHHVKFMTPIYQYTDPLYFGLIEALQFGGKYKLLNILILGLLWPLLIYFLLIRSLDLRRRINTVKSNSTEK